MYKKTRFVIPSLTLLAFLLATPAFAGFGGSPTDSPVLNEADRSHPSLTSWLAAFYDWLDRAFEEAGVGVREAGRESEDSDSGIEVTPMAGPDGDPNG